MNTLQFPSATADIHAEVTSFINELKTHVSNQAGNLDELSSPFHTPSDISESAAELSALRDELNSLLFSGHAIALTPYQYNIGNDQFLSADSALNFAAQKLTDQYDSIKGSFGLALIITGYSESVFANNLVTLTNVLAFPEWKAVADHASKNAVLEIEKMQIPATRNNPYWRQDDYGHQTPLSESEQLIGSEISLAEAAAESATSPVERLKQLATLQNQMADELISNVESIISLFSGQCYAVKLSGTPQQMAETLQDTTISTDPHSTMFLMVSEQEPTFFYQMVGV